MANFSKAFEETLFSDVQHTVGRDMGEHVELKSSVLLAQDAANDAEHAGCHQGDLDHLIGNTKYVFANATALASHAAQLAGARGRYRITSEDGYVVPYDIASMHCNPAKVDASCDYPAIRLELYADNIYSIPDFKKVFALYSAVLFDSPEDALGFYQTYQQSMEHADRWDLNPSTEVGGRWRPGGNDLRYTEFKECVGMKSLRASDHSVAIALQMRSLMDEYSIYPPMEPEFQFKGQVATVRVTTT